MSLLITVALILGAIVGSVVTNVMNKRSNQHGTFEITQTEEGDKCLLKLDTLEDLAKKKRIVLNVKILK